jgi:exodeoxyribonuclease-3
VKIATWNVNGLRAREAQLVDWVRRDKPDVVCLQEIKATPDQLSETLTLLPEYWNYWHGGPKGYSGVSMHVRKESFAAKPEFTHPAFDTEYRAVQAKLDGGLVVASIYVPNGGKGGGKDFSSKLAFLRGMRAYVDGALAAGHPLVLCGDLNVARTDRDVTEADRKRGAIGQRADERALLEAILDGGMVDTLRALDPDNDALFTWWAPWREMRQKNQGWRIDYVLASAALRATECKVFPDVGTSDHAPVVATLQPSG